ncbi:MAG: thiol-disulfide isomerase/thioredoxin, partial [Colwellia sp.]
MLYTKIRKSVTRVESALVVELKVINRSAINNVLILRTLLANLWFVSLHDNQLLTPINRSNDKKDKPVNAKKKFRRTNRYSRFVANEILDKLVKAGYVKRKKGRENSFEGVATWCVATKKLLHLIAQFEDESDKNVSIFSKLNPKLVILRNANKEPQKIRTTYVRKAKKLAEPARLMNQLLESIDVTLAEYVDGILIVKPLF